MNIKYIFLLCFKKNVLFSTFIDKKAKIRKITKIDNKDNKVNSLLLFINSKNVINRLSFLIKDLIPSEIHFSFGKVVKTG